MQGASFPIAQLLWKLFLSLNTFLFLHELHEQLIVWMYFWVIVN